MKKILAMALCTVMSVTIIGCSSKNNNPPKNEGTNNVESNQGSNQNSNRTMYFGKVKSIVGNEIELEIAENQDDDSEEDENKSQVAGQLGAGVDQSATMSDMELFDPNASEGAGGGGNNNLPESDTSKLELKYTGETKTFTVPAGALIFDLRSASESKVSSIKNGSVIRIYGTGTDTMVMVSNIEIVE